MKFSEVHLAWIGLGSNRTIGTGQFLTSFKTFFFLFGFMGSLFGFSAVYVYNNASDVANVMNPSLVMSAGIACTGSYVYFGLQVKAMKDLNIHLQAIVDEGMCFVRHILRSKTSIVILFDFIVIPSV